MMPKTCMVVDCGKEAVKAVYDGFFWVAVCQGHAIEFRETAKVNHLKFSEKELSEPHKEKD